MNPNLQEVTFDTIAEQTADLLTQRDEMDAILKRATELKATIDAELFKRCATNEGRELRLVPEGRVVKIITVRDFKSVPIEFADAHSATQIVVNTKVLKALADTGLAVPGIKEREQLYVK